MFESDSQEKLGCRTICFLWAGVVEMGRAVRLQGDGGVVHDASSTRHSRVQHVNCGSRADWTRIAKTGKDGRELSLAAEMQGLGGRREMHRCVAVGKWPRCAVLLM